MNPVFANLPTTIFDVMSGLARTHGAINLGQGFPEHQGPADIKAAAAEAMVNGVNQYPPMRGLPALREGVAAHYARAQGLPLTADNVVVTSGGTEAIASAVLGLVAPGDEVVLFEPAYDAYLPLVKLAGATARIVRLEPPLWRITEAALEAAITPRTRLVMFNNPHNPTGRLFDAEEVAILARACVAHDLVAVCDDVWEHVRFDGAAYRPLIAEPGMAERTVKIGSAGKIFSMTGWKVGWAVAAASLIGPVAGAHQFLTFTTAPALQTGVAFGLSKPDAWFDAMRADYQRSRDRLAAALAAQGYAVLPSQATYFICVDLAASGVNLDDEAFCRQAVTEAGVAAIPVSAFYHEAPVRSVVRLCFAKNDDTLDQGAERLGRFRRGQ